MLAEKFKDILQTLITVAIIIGLTTLLYLYTSGYRLQPGENKPIDITQTGMVNAKSIPESASVYLDDKLVTATNDTVGGIEPGEHELRIVKKGFVEWKKVIEVFPELVTDITAVLVSQTPRLEPLTNTGARDPIISHTLSKLAYFSYDAEEPGIWVVPLSGSGLGLFRSNPSIAIEDTRFVKYSQGVSIEWSPDETNLLIEGQNEVFYLIDLEQNTAETTSSPQLVRDEWEADLLKKRDTILSKLDIPDKYKEIALSDDAIWSPDEKKFLYTVQEGDKIRYKVFNFESPLPVGEQVETIAFETNSWDPQPKVSWYTDSFHLILVEGDVADDKRGVISLIRIDGSNKVEIYNNTLLSDAVYSSPGGDKLIIVTSFKSGDQADLYTLGIR